jgi:hypothetical protein
MLNFTICRMLERVGMYWYILPTYEQARLTIWEGRGSGVNEGMPFLDHFPEELVEKKNEQRLEVELVNGSIFRLVGSDNVDRLVGANPVGVIYSEFSLQNKSAWDYVSPMLVENKGWAAFIFTPRGKNYAQELYDLAKNNKTWFTSVKTIEMTCRDAEEEDNSPVVTEADLDEERKMGQDEDMIQQEYYCSFVGFRAGSYFGSLMAAAHSENRIRTVPWNPRVPVFTSWDLGIADMYAIWFIQVEGREIFCIDYHEANNKPIGHFIALCKNKPYVYSNHWAPHDIEQRHDQGTSVKSRMTLARELGLNFKVIPKMSLMDGIDSARSVIPRCYFDKVKCDLGIRALINYHREFNPKTQDYRDNPVHDKSCHGTDAFRGMSVIVDKETNIQLNNRPVKYEKDFELFGSDKRDSPFDNVPNEVEIIRDNRNRFDRFAQGE